MMGMLVMMADSMTGIIMMMTDQTESMTERWTERRRETRSLSRTPTVARPNKASACEFGICQVRTRKKGLITWMRRTN